MSDENKVGLQTDPNDISNIEKLIKTIDKLDGSLQHLAQAGRGMNDLKQMMTTMQATMVTGFTEMSKAAQKSDDAILTSRKKTNDQLVAEEEKAWQKLFFTSQANLSKMEAAQDASNARKLERAAAAQMKSLEQEVSAANKQAAAYKAILEKRDIETLASNQRNLIEYTKFWEQALAKQEKAAAAQVAIERKRDVELNQISQKKLVDYVQFWEKTLAIQEAAQAKELASSVAARARALAAGVAGNTSQAQSNSTSITSALSSNLTSAYSSSVPAIHASQGALISHNNAMNEAHALSRGLAGSLGGLWLTYGSAVPLLAGAAVAASLKNVLTVGKEVEQQLNFVYALSAKGEGVNLDSFLKITDSSLSSVVESANAMRMLAQNGLEAGEALRVLPTVLNLATVGEMSVSQAALAVTGAVSAFGLEMSQAGHVADVFAKAAATSNTSVLAMTESMKQASTVSSLFNVSLEDTASMIGRLAKINITGGAAGTSITNLLTSLYEPTEKGKKALKELGVETHQLSGELKPVPLLLEEMRSALAKLNESAGVELLGSITTVRGLKAGKLLLDNIEDFKKGSSELQTLSGFTQGVVKQLEDSTTGAFDRLGVVVQNTFVKAFQQAGPEVQSLGQHLAGLAGSGEAVTMLGNLATNVTLLARLTLDATPGIVGLYAAYKLFGGLVPLFNTYTAAVAASTVASATATAASAGLATGMGAITGTSALAATALEAEAAAATAATVASSAFMSLMLPALGALAIAAAAAAAVWLIFRDNLNEADRANTKLDNSLHVIGDSLDKEIARLKTVNELWDKRNGKYRDSAEVTAPQLERARANVTDIEAKVRASGGNPDSIRNPEISVDAGSGVVAATDGFNKYAGALLKADQILSDLTEKEKIFKDVVQPGQALEKAQNDISQLNKELEKFAKLGTDKNSKGEFDQPSEEIRDKYLQALEIKKQLVDLSSGTGKVLTDGELERLNALRVDFKQLNSEVQGMLGTRAPKVDKKAANDGLKADLERLQLAKELLAVQQRTTDMEQRAANKAGTLGDLQLLDAQNKAAREKVQTSIEIARASIGEVSGIENKRAAEQKFRNQEIVGAAELVELDKQLAISKSDLFRQRGDEQVKFQAKSLADSNQYVAAYLMEYEANYGPTIKRVEEDLTNVIGIQNYARLQSYLNYLKGVKEAGITEATGKSLMADFNKDLTELQAKLSTLSNLSGANAGLGAVFTNAYAAMDEYASRIGDIAAKQKELQDLATANPGDPKLQQNATAELSKMAALAEQMRSMWVSVAGTIGDSLTTAFGRGGTALGGLLQATVAYAAQKSRIEEEKGKAGDDPVEQLQAQQAAAKALESAQLSAYAKMAGAAKGYFKENSVGYQVASTAEKAFTVLQLAEAARMFVVKSGYLMGLLGIQVASQAEAAAAEGAYTLSSIAMAGARAAASGVAAAVSAMVGWPFPLNIIALGATIAAVGALGVKIAGGGGGGPASAMERQASNGTGTNPDGTLNGGGILGDAKAKSESISKSLDIIEKNSGLGLAHTISMDNSLKQLVAGISGLASLLVQGTNLTSPIAKDTQGAQQGIFDKVLGNQSIGEKLSGGLLNKIVGGIFGGATSVEDVGLKLNSGTLSALMQSGGVSVSQYTDTKKKGGLFSSDKYSTKYEELGPEINDQFSKIFASLYDTVVAGANILGLGGDAFSEKLKGFVIDIGEISTKGMTGEEIEKALQTAFSKLGDDMAKFGVDGLQQFQKVGEGYLETLTRVANDFLQVNDVLSVLGKNFNVTGLAAVTLSESLIAAAGGLETLTENTGYFVENFLTEAEKMAPIIKSVDNAFAQLGVKVPSTIEDYKNLVLSQDLNTIAGQQMYAALIAIAPQFKTIADYAAEMSGVLVKSAQEIRDERKNLQDQLDNLTMTPVQLAAKDRAQIDPSNLALYDQVTALTNAAKAAAAVTSSQDALITAYQAQQSAMQSVIDTAKKLRQTMLDLKTSLQLGTLSTLTPEQKLAEAKNRYEGLLARAKAGDKDAQSQIGSAAQDFLTADRAYNASNSVYASDAMKVQKDLSDLADLAGNEANTAQQQLDALTKQVTALVTIDSTLTSGFDKVQQAILDLAAALASAGGKNTPDMNDSIVSGLFNTILGRAPEKGGLDFWSDALDKGTSLDVVTQDIKNSDESLNRQVEKLYTNILGRSSEAAGKEFWVNALKSGVSLDQITKDFYSSPEYLASHGGAHAYGGVAGEGYALVGEKGPEVVQVGSTSRVYNASQTAGMFSPNTAANDDSSRRLAALEEEAKADKRQRAIIAQAAAEDARKQRELMAKLIATQRSANTTRRSK